MVSVNFCVRFAIKPVVKFSEGIANGQALFLDLRVSLFGGVEDVGCVRYRLEMSLTVGLIEGTAQAFFTCIYL